MSCCLCLSETEILIPVFDEIGRDAKGIAAVVSKFLGVKLGRKNVNKVMICISCWANLDNFQKFCRLVEEKQSQLRLLTKTETSEHDDASLDYMAEAGEDIEMEIEMVELQDPPEDCVKDVLLVATQDINTTELEDLVPKCNDFSHDEQNNDKNYEKETDHSESNVELNMKRSTRGRPRTRVLKETIKTVEDKSKPARKIGRPAKSDASFCLEEDRLIAKHLLLVCDECQSEQKNFYELKQHFKKEHKREGYAVCCNKRLYKKGLLVEHIHVHNNPDYFKCEECSHVFADRVCLRNHTLLKHNQDNDLPFECKHCSKKFAKLYFLQRHVLKHATGEEKTHQCTYCKKGYPSLSRLKGHIRNVHGDGGLKVCSHCGALIRGTTAFQKHMRQHEGIVDRGAQCKICGQWLSDKYVLRLHMERHEDPKTYTCELCGKEAPSRVAMNAHHRYHHINPEPTHKCTICGKAFKTPRSLREHVATHTGHALYVCTYCPKTFKCSSNLHSHRKWQHPVEWSRDKQALNTSA